MKETINELYKITITVDDFRERLYDDINHLYPSDYGLSIHVPDERDDDLVDVFCETVGEKPYDYDDTGLNEFGWWFMNSHYMDGIEALIGEAMDEWISERIDEAAEQLGEEQWRGYSSSSTN